MNDRQPASRDDQAAIRNAPEGRERALYLGRVANVGRAQGKTAIGSISLAKKIAKATSGVNSISPPPTNGPLQNLAAQIAQVTSS